MPTIVERASDKGTPAMAARWISVLLAGCAALAFVPAAHAQPAQRDPCFYSDDWSNWRSSPDAKAIYLRVDANRILRLDLAQACPDLQAPFARLIVSSHRGGAYCSPLDFDLHVVAGAHGLPAGCLVSKLTELTSSEVAALPKSLRP